MRVRTECDSKPSRSLGSNHVDFGGMMPPASDTCMMSSMLTGYIEKATAASPLAYQTLERVRYRVRRRRSRCACHGSRRRYQARAEDLLVQTADIESQVGGAPARSAAICVYQRSPTNTETSPRREDRRDRPPHRTVPGEVPQTWRRVGPEIEHDPVVRKDSAPRCRETPPRESRPACPARRRARAALAARW